MLLFFFLENEKDEKSNVTNEEAKKDGGANPWFRRAENPFKEWNLELAKWTESPWSSQLFAATNVPIALSFVDIRRVFLW